MTTSQYVDWDAICDAPIGNPQEEAKRKQKYLLNVRNYCRSNVDITEDPACVAANKLVIEFIDKELAPANCITPGKCPTPRGYVCGGCARGY